MRLLRTILFAWLRLHYLFDRAAGRGAFAYPEARPVAAPPGTSDNPLKSALWKHYVHQFNAASCSVASVATVVNALLETTGHLDRPVRQLDLLEAVHTANWKQRMSEKGDHGKRGLPLPLLATIVESSLDACRVAYRRLETLQAVKDPQRAGSVRQALMRHLTAFETRADRLIIAHFDQGVTLRSLHIPHISPVGAFEPQTAAVTVLDVDPEAPGPYRISFDLFYRALSSDYNPLFRKFGYGSGGCLIVEMETGKKGPS